MISGLHHISLKCATLEEFEKAKKFYVDLLGFTIVREWPEGIMIDFGNGMLEIFNNGEGIKTKGALRHIAFATDNVDEIADMVKKAGYEVFIEPNDIVIKSNPVLPARMAFCFGPLGEEIEFFQEQRSRISDDKNMKNGDYTVFNNHEYLVSQSYDLENMKRVVKIFTYNIDDIDDSFQYDETYKYYYKIVDPHDLGDVFSYSIDHYYKGHKVQKCVGKQGQITLFTNDSKFAMENGFEEHDPRDRDYLKKDVSESEIEAVQIGPTLNARYRP